MDKNRGDIMKVKMGKIEKMLTRWAKKNNLLKLGEQIVFTLVIKQFPLVEQDLLSRSIKDIELTVRAKNICVDLGCETIGDLIRKTPDELLEHRNCNDFTIRTIQDELHKFGLKLAS